MNDSNSNEQPYDDDTIKKLIARFNDKVGMKRQEARLALIKAGNPAVPLLIEALSSSDEHVRWEAAKTLVSIKDPRAAPALVNALMDKSSQVRWLAAEALIALRRSALVPLFKELELHADSVNLMQGAHHILYDLKKTGILDDSSLQVLTDLSALDNQMLVPLSARKALDSILQSNGPE